MLCCAATLANHPPALAFGGSTPDPRLLPCLQCVFEAGDSPVSSGPHSLCLQRQVVVVRVEHGRLQTPTRPQLSPYDLFDRHDWFSPAFWPADGTSPFQRA